MKKFSTFFAPLLASIALFSGCAAQRGYHSSSAPQTLEGVLHPAGGLFSFKAPPYGYALYDINGDFVSYADLSRIGAPNVEQYSGHNVVMRGTFDDTPDGLVLRADHIKFNR